MQGSKQQLPHSEMTHKTCFIPLQRQCGFDILQVQHKDISTRWQISIFTVSKVSSPLKTTQVTQGNNFLTECCILQHMILVIFKWHIYIQEETSCINIEVAEDSYSWLFWQYTDYLLVWRTVVVTVGSFYVIWLERNCFILFVSRDLTLRSSNRDRANHLLII